MTINKTSLIGPTSLHELDKPHLQRCRTLTSFPFSSVAQSCPTLCDPTDWSMPDFPVHQQLLELAQTHVHRVGDAIQPSHTLSSPFSSAFNLSQHQGLFQWDLEKTLWLGCLQKEQISVTSRAFVFAEWFMQMRGQSVALKEAGEGATPPSTPSRLSAPFPVNTQAWASPKYNT